jgi:hypothetical protein
LPGATSTPNSDWKKSFYDSSVKISGGSSNSSGVNSAEIPESTPTSELAKEFFTKVVQLRQAGMNTDEESISKVANRLVQDASTGAISASSYSLRDLHIVKQGTNPDLEKTYAVELSNIISNAFPAENEAEIAARAFDSGDLTILKQITPIVVSYKNARATLLNMQVPESVALYHLDLVNGVSIQVFNSEALLKAETDPVSALTAVSVEVEALQKVLTAINSIKSYFDSTHIVFAPSAPSLVP